MSSFRLNLILVAIAVVGFFLVHSASRTKSLTWDEPTFIVSGYTYLDKGELKLSPDNPPLMQVLSAFPLLFLNLQPPDYSHDDYDSNRRVQFANLFFETNANKFELITILSRLSVQFLFALLVIVTGLFVKKLAGTTSAIIASIFVGFSPNLIAHGQLATTDFGCTAFMFIAVYALYNAFRSENNKVWIVCGLITAFAFLSKYTALLLSPIYFFIILYELKFNNRNKGIVLRGITFLIFTILLILCLAYKFTPWQYLSGVSQIYVRNSSESYYYLFGNVLDGAVWYYYFSAFIVKTPVSILLLLLLSFYICIRYQPKNDVLIYLLVPVSIIMFVCSFDTHNLGIRRVLPIFPFLLCFIACVFNYIKTDKFKLTIFCVLIVWNVVETLVSYPHYISFFNSASGGALNGPNLLEDSNLDWGQDLPALVEWQKNNLPENMPINLMYFGAINPRLYGLHFRQITEEELISPKNGIYAISTHYLIYTRKLAFWNKAEFDWLKLYEPVGYAGNSIYIYQFTDEIK